MTDSELIELPSRQSRYPLLRNADQDSFASEKLWSAVRELHAGALARGMPGQVTFDFMNPLSVRLLIMAIRGATEGCGELRLTVTDPLQPTAR